MKRLSIINLVNSSGSKRLIFIFSIVVFILFQLNKNSRQDDDFIGEQVFWLLKTGHVKSELMRGFNNIGLENYQSIFHKFLIYNGYVLSKIFGWSLYTLHAVSLIYLFIFFAFFYLFLKKNQDSFGENMVFIAIPVILICNGIAYYSFCFRPEIMIMALGFGSYWQLSRYLDEKKLIGLVFSSFLAGLAFASHLNGLIFIVAGFVLLLTHQRWKEGFIFGFCSTLLFGIIYFSDILIHSDIQQFIVQFKNDPSIDKANYEWYSPFIKILDEHIRFFFTEKEIFLSLLLIYSIIVGFKFLKRQHRDLLIYTLVLVISLGCYTYSKTPKYLLLYFPFLILIILVTVRNSFMYAQNNKLIIHLSLFFAFIAVQLYGDMNQIIHNFKHWNRKSEIEINAEVAGHIPNEHNKLNIIAPEGFIFNEIKNFNRIHTMVRYSFFNEFHGRPKNTFAQVIDSAYKYDIHYVIFNKTYKSYFGLEEPLRSAFIANRSYQITTDKKDLIIVKLDTPIR